MIDGRHVDLVYRDVDRVNEAIDACCEGRIESIYQLGHPLGFHNQIYLAEVHFCHSLHDPIGLIKGFKCRIGEYPDAMRQSLIAKHLFDAAFELGIAEKPASRGDVLFVTACASRVIGFLLLVLYAINRRYYINEKGALAESRSFELVPPGFHPDAADVLGRIGTMSAQLAATLQRLGNLVETVRHFSTQYA
jgi:hypothetical protein